MTQVYSYPHFDGGDFNRPPLAPSHLHPRTEEAASSPLNQHQLRSSSIARNQLNGGQPQRDPTPSHSSHHQYDAQPQAFQKPPAPPAGPQLLGNSRKISLPESVFGQQPSQPVYQGSYLNAPVQAAPRNFRDPNQNTSLPSQLDQPRFEQHYGYAGSFTQHAPQQQAAPSHSFADIYRGYPQQQASDAPHDTSVFLQGAQQAQPRPASNIYTQNPPASTQAYFHSARNIALNPQSYATQTQEQPADPRQPPAYSSHYYPQPLASFEHQAYHYALQPSAYQPISRAAQTFPQQQVHARQANPLKCPGTWTKRNERPLTGS